MNGALAPIKAQQKRRVGSRLTPLAVTRHRAHQTDMLALDDAALARICIGASRIPRGQRRRWLRKIADELDGDRAKQRHAARQAHHRQRQRAGARVYRLELADRVMEDVLTALVSYGRLSEADTLKRAAVERALVEIIADIGRRFVMFRDDIR